MEFPLQLASQLREHLRGLRKARGLTQLELGRLLGIGQARMAEIESNPGVVSVEQLMKVLSALEASLVLRDELIVRYPPAAPAPQTPATAETPKKPIRGTTPRKTSRSQGLTTTSSPSQPFVIDRKKGSW